MFSFYLVVAGLLRFLVEFIRINPIAYLEMTGAQLISILMIILGIVGILARNRLPSETQN